MTTTKVSRKAEIQRQVPVFQRIVLKLSGESLQGSQGFGIHAETVVNIAREVKEVNDLGVQVAIMVGGGNIFRGTRQKSLAIDRATGDYMGMLATVINGLALMEIKAQVILKATRVDGIYDADPEKVSGARMFERISYLDVIQKGLTVMDSTAISLCMDNKLPIIVFNMNVPGNIKRVVLGEKVGSAICPS